MTWGAIHTFFYSIVGIIFLTYGGNWCCHKFFTITGLKEVPENTGEEDSSHTEQQRKPAGWIIGLLERLIFAIAIIFQVWALLAAVIALKSVARFQELNKQQFAEYFLVGSLFSILWAILVTWAWIVYDRELGTNLYERTLTMIEMPNKQVK